MELLFGLALLAAATYLGYQLGVQHKHQHRNKFWRNNRRR
jgi:hypothetical protein